MYLLEDVALLLFAVFDVAESFLFEITLEEERLDVLELHEQFLELFVIVLLNSANFLTHARELVDLRINLVVELTNLILEVVHFQLIEHDNIVVAVLAQEALEADRAKAVLAEGLDVFIVVDLAF